MSHRHIVMVQTNGKVRCSCALHPCPHPPQLGDPFCKTCREHCQPELDKRRKRSHVKLAILAGALIYALAWLAGHFFGG